MRILITGARAPACLEWARILRQSGCSVAAADSADCPLARFSACVERWYRLPPANRDVNAYGEALLAAASEFRADLILPTCEEAFYAAHQKRRLERQCPAVVSDFGLMAGLHDKAAFAELAGALPISAPPTVRLDSPKELREQAPCARSLVFKPAFSRFAARTLIRPDAAALHQITPGSGSPWIAQEFVAGRELCSYSLLHKGRLLAHACYQPKYRVGTGSGIYIDPVESTPIREFVREFGMLTGYTGQAGFDYIEMPEGGLRVLECNPRATSGIHLFAGQAAALTNALRSFVGAAEPKEVVEAAGSARRVSVAMALFAAPKLRSLAAAGEFGRDWRRATDIVSTPGDRLPALAQFGGLAEMLLRSVQLGCSLLAATTADIEWNGQDLGPHP